MKRNGMITDYFQRKIRRIEDEEENSVEEIDDTDNSTHESTSLDTINAKKSNQFHLIYMLQQRELPKNKRKQFSTSIIPSHWQERWLIRWALKQLQIQPMEIELPLENRYLFEHKPPPYVTSLEFDRWGSLLVAGTSNGCIAVYDFDQYFHETIDSMQRSQDMENMKKISVLQPIHCIWLKPAIKQVIWNPFNQDEIACCFSDWNAIHTYNLALFPTKPWKVLKTNSVPSAGYNCMVFRQTRIKGTEGQLTCQLIAGDINGFIRMWNLNLPSRVQWCQATGSHPVTALALSPSQDILVCGTAGGYIEAYNVEKLSTPAFGSRAMPQRILMIHLSDLIKPYKITNLHHNQFTALHQLVITCMKILPLYTEQVVCQLRNGWILSIDYVRGKLTKIREHKDVVLNVGQYTPTFSQVQTIRDQSTGDLPPHDELHPSNRHHRCSGTLLFGGSILCTGVYNDPSLYIYDLDPLPNKSQVDIDRIKSDKDETSIHPIKVARIGRMRVPSKYIITAVCGHPKREFIVSGSEGNRLRVHGIMGKIDRTKASTITADEQTVSQSTSASDA